MTGPAERFRERPHVGAVTHFEGRALPEVTAALTSVMEGFGLSHEDSLERAAEGKVFSSVARLPVSDEMELWVLAGAVQGVGCKVEMRVFHALDEGALADEYLARFAKTLNERF